MNRKRLRHLDEKPALVLQVSDAVADLDAADLALSHRHAAYFQIRRAVDEIHRQADRFFLREFQAGLPKGLFEAQQRNVLIPASGAVAQPRGRHRDEEREQDDRRNRRQARQHDRENLARDGLQQPAETILPGSPFLEI
ncbi:MAG: hypothetical protein HY770_04180 [Chitinivibrionia bacterium]|nr:hypothetical protein [Chitinivibrionia bacterium]